MYDRIWMLPAATPGAGESFDELAAQVRDVLVTEFGVHPSKLDGEVLVEGHSAGGIALRNVAVSAPATKVAEYLFLDAGFQGWADGCWNAIVAHGADARVTMVITEKGIADPLAGRDPWCVYGKASVSLWPTVQGWCEGKMDKKPPGQTDKCQAIATAAEHWPEYEAWCQALESDMRDVPGVTVVRTKVVHAEQPRRFAGGLGLPPDRHAR